MFLQVATANAALAFDRTYLKRAIREALVPGTGTTLILSEPLGFDDGDEMLPLWADEEVGIVIRAC